MTGSSSAKQRQAEIRDLLVSCDLAAVVDWSADSRAPLRTLASLLFDPEETVVWRTIESFGLVVGRQDRDPVHRLLQRFFWMMNDESGAICWYAPEAVAEVLSRRPEFLGEFGRILLSYVMEEPFEAGVCWGISRLIKTGNEASLGDDLRLVLPHLLDHLYSKRARLRGMAVLALTAMNRPSARSSFEAMTDDTGELNVYDFATGQLRPTTVAALAKLGLETLK